MDLARKAHKCPRRPCATTSTLPTEWWTDRTPNERGRQAVADTDRAGRRASSAASRQEVGPADGPGRLAGCHGPNPGDVPDDRFEALLRVIVGQQLSIKAARTISRRLADPFDVPLPLILAADVDELRAIGLSRAKVGYVRSLSEHVISGELDVEGLDELNDDEVIARPTAVRGLGRWSADIFLIFQLGTRDVLPVSELGIRRAIERLVGSTTGLAVRELEQIAEPWRPHRTLASLYLWESLGETKPS
jgi:DNA-3-methyladenine glycosylase II